MLANSKPGPQVELEIKENDAAQAPEDINLCIYRVLQEALLNIEKHAGARRVQVKLGIAPGKVSLSIEDDGKGFLVPLRIGQFANEGNFGLLGLSERVELAGGELRIRSAPGKGCTLDVQIPFAEHPMEIYDANQGDDRGRPPDRPLRNPQ